MTGVAVENAEAFTTDGRIAILGMRVSNYFLINCWQLVAQLIQIYHSEPSKAHHIFGLFAVAVEDYCHGACLHAFDFDVLVGFLPTEDMGHLAINGCFLLDDGVMFDETYYLIHANLLACIALEVGEN